MRLTIRHETTYRFETPAASVIQTLRLWPRGHDGQHVVRWRLDVDRNCRLRAAEDAFGNQTHVFAAEGPLDELTVLVEGEVDTQDNAGVVARAAERFPPSLYLRQTPLTAHDQEISAFAEEVRSSAGDGELASLHGLLDRLHAEMAFAPGLPDGATTAAEAFRVKRGSAQDLTHVFLTAARRLRIPARYVSGYVRREGCASQDAMHGWAEAYVPHLGWVGFDPAEGACPTESHVRVAIGLDYLGAAPVRGSRYGGSGETLEMAVLVEDARASRSYRRS